MKYINIYLSISNYLFIVFVGFQGCQNIPKKNDENLRPNIIYILADDLGYGDLSCYGQEKFNTPNIDRLSKMGMLFKQHYRKFSKILELSQLQPRSSHYSIISFSKYQKSTVTHTTYIFEDSRILGF